MKSQANSGAAEGWVQVGLGKLEGGGLGRIEGGRERDAKGEREGEIQAAGVKGAFCQELKRQQSKAVQLQENVQTGFGIIG